MDAKKIAAFMKQLRSEKGYTQEQLGEALGISGRTVSRWETGVNLPELSILVQMADFYNVEIKELLIGERETEGMNEQMRETLKIASDYNEMLKKKAIRDTNIAFIVSFITCTLVIIIQMLIFDSQRIIMGETVVLLTGGITYIVLLMKDGAWDSATKMKNTKTTHLLVSTGVSLVMSILFYIKVFRVGNNENLILMTGLFFLIMSAISYLVLREILKVSDNKKENLDSDGC